MQTSAGRNTELFNHFKKRYQLLLTSLLKGYIRRFDVMEKAMIQAESLASFIYNGDVLGEKNTSPIKMALFTLIYETLNTLKHPLLIEGQPLYDAKVNWTTLILQCVARASKQ